MKLSILDQSPVIDGMTAAQALANSVDLAVRADAWGYARYWLAEHHGSASFASASPEVMMTRIAAATTQIRIGSGGILLPHYAPLKVAELARSMHALFPDRIDLGIGRAPGGDAAVVRALHTDTGRDAHDAVRDLLSYLSDPRASSSAHSAVAVPDGVEMPEVWILGTGVESARLAARAGLRYAFGAFIDPTHLAQAMQIYWGEFTPSRFCATPTTMIATVAFVADTDAEAHRLTACSEAWFVASFLRGIHDRFPRNIDSLRSSYTVREQMMVDLRRRTIIVGDPRSAYQQLEAYAQAYATSEIAIVTITDDHASRCRSYELLMEQRLLHSK